MSDAAIKGVRRSSSRSVSHDTPSTKAGKSIGKSVRPVPIVKRTAADKAPVQKAVKSRAVTTAATGSKAAKASKIGPTSQSKKLAARIAKNKNHTLVQTVGKSSKKSNSKAAKAPTKGLDEVDLSASSRHQTSAQAAALLAFELAHKAFSRGHFTEARTLFRSLVEMPTNAAEVVARARTYLSVIEVRLQTERALPRDADGLYDRGVIALNCGEYAAAQDLFERALKREPEAAHIHYGLAATRARLGAVISALRSLEYALVIKPSLRIRAQSDQDLAPLRHEPDFERIVFALR